MSEIDERGFAAALKEAHDGIVRPSDVRYNRLREIIEVHKAAKGDDQPDDCANDKVREILHNVMTFAAGLDDEDEHGNQDFVMNMADEAMRALQPYLRYPARESSDEAKGQRAYEVCGMKVIVNDGVPPGEMWVKVGNEIQRFRLLDTSPTIESSADVERKDTIAMLRIVCSLHGDNDWPDDLHMADIIEKHLLLHLEHLTGDKV